MCPICEVRKKFSSKMYFQVAELVFSETVFNIAAICKDNMDLTFFKSSELKFPTHESLELLSVS